MYEQKVCSLFVKAKHKVEIGDMGASIDSTDSGLCERKLESWFF